MNTKDILNSYQAKKTKQRKGIIIACFFVLLFILINVVLHFFLFPVRQKSVSMSPDIPSESIIMTTPLVPYLERGDVVVMEPLVNEKKSFFNNIATMFTSFFTGQQIFPGENSIVPGTKQKLRRVVGVPGDTIYMKDYVLYVKPQGAKHFLTEFEVASRPYNITFYSSPDNWDDTLCTKGSFEPFTLQNEQYFVLADDRKATDDSRLWGPVSKDDIVSKGLFCYFPFSEFKFL